MLKRSIGLLIAANIGYALWSQGHLFFLGERAQPGTLHEPQRVAQQISANALQIITLQPTAQPTEATANPTMATAPITDADAPPTQTAPPQPKGKCLRIGALSEAQYQTLLTALEQKQTTPANQRNMSQTTLPARWIVYIGKIGDAVAMVAKKSELRGMHIDFREVNNPALQPGLALATLKNEDDATQALRDFIKKGVKTAKIAIEREEAKAYNVQWQDVTPTQQRNLQKLGPALAGKTLQTCS